MQFLIEYLRSIGSEYQIDCFNKTIYSSTNYKKIDTTDSISEDIYYFNDKYYQKKIVTISIQNVNYTINLYNDVTKFAKEVIKSKIDFLTKLPNRSQIENYISKIKTDCVIVMIDIDDFKKINDTYGHQIGDSVIKLLGDLIRNYIDSNDFAGRYGGEEFLIIFNKKDELEVKKIVDKINWFLNKYTDKLKVSISGGIYKFDPKIERVETAIRKADEALYFVKHNGKNATIIYDNMKLNHFK